MAISLASLKRVGDTETPPRMIIFGVAGIGKNSIVAGAPAPVFIQIEDGMKNRRLKGLATFGILSSYGEVVEAIGALVTDDHDHKTVVFDSLDWLEPLIWRETCRRNSWNSIEDAGFGKGYTAALDVWREFLDGCNALTDRGMAIVFLAHHTVRRYEAPDLEPFDRYRIKLHESKAGIGANPLLMEHVDAVFFMNWRTSVVKDGSAAEKKAGGGRTRGVGGAQRVVYTEERPAYVSKNRWDMPDSINLPDMQETDDIGILWQTLAQYIPYFSAA
jgi:hypothetical protein